MSKCSDCRSLEALDTWWDRARYRLMQYLFAEDLIDLTQQKYTQGFGDGRKMGYEQCLNQQRTKEEVFKEMILEDFKNGIIEKYEENVTGKN